MIETMFDGVGEGELLAVMAGAQRDERVAVARRLLAAGRLCQLRMAAVGAEERTQWCIDNWEAVAAEVGAELSISRARASVQMNYGVELLERLPRLAEVFAAGEVDFRVVAAVVYRTGLMTDPQLLAELDKALARRAVAWNRLSRRRVAEMVDQWVIRFDPAALRAARSAEEDRRIEFGDVRNGMVEFWGALRAADAMVLDRRLDQLAAEAGPEDERTKAQRRADALAGLAASERSGGQAPVVIHVLAEAGTVSGTSQTPGYLAGYGALSPQAVRELAGRARLRPLTPVAELRSEPRYRPSAALADFIRARDLCCRFPGCDKPAEVCDIDHTIPWEAGGPTHPSNCALLCRAHHLLKTFWAGEKGWAEKQFADGTIVWTSPSGRTYTTTPAGALFFPQLSAPGAEITTRSAAPPRDDGRTRMMPKRRRSRAAERQARIRWERGLNEQRWAADPPPF